MLYILQLTSDSRGGLRKISPRGPSQNRGNPAHSAGPLGAPRHAAASLGVFLTQNRGAFLPLEWGNLLAPGGHGPSGLPGASAPVSPPMSWNQARQEKMQLDVEVSPPASAIHHHRCSWQMASNCLQMYHTVCYACTHEEMFLECRHLAYL